MSRPIRERIPGETLKEIFPRKFSRYQSADRVYTQLKKMILSGKLKKGQKITQEKIVQRFGINNVAVVVAFSRLRKEKLITTKRGIGSFVA